MPRDAAWTYELSAGASDPEGIEEYAVETADGERVGRVAGVVRRDGETFLAIEQGFPPLAQQLRAVPWATVDEVDVETAAVRLTVDAAELEARALVLDPQNKVEDGPAEAVRVTQLPAGIPRYAEADARGPRDRPVAVFLPFLAVAGATLGIAAAALAAAGVLWAAIVLALVAAGLLGGSGVQLFRVYRDPYARD
jgi:hypothetical protein